MKPSETSEPSSLPGAHYETRILHLLESIDHRLQAIEGKMTPMATRADFDQLKQTLKADIAVIVQAVADLKAQLANGSPITDQDLSDLQADIDTLTGGAPVPPPTPTR